VKRQGTKCRNNIASLIRILKEALEEITEFSYKDGSESPRNCTEGRYEGTVQRKMTNTAVNSRC
jgi:hypothetical protein